jgi:hypothetical protein
VFCFLPPIPSLMQIISSTLTGTISDIPTTLSDFKIDPAGSCPQERNAGSRRNDLKQKRLVCRLIASNHKNQLAN